MCWSFLSIEIRQAKIRKKAEMQVVFLLKTSLAIQNTISFAPRTLRLLPIHIPLHLPQRDKKTRKSAEKSLLSSEMLCLHVKCADVWRYWMLLSCLSLVHLRFMCASLLSFPAFLLCIFVCAFWLPMCAYMCARITQRSCVFLLSHLSHAGKKHVNSSAKTPIRQSGIELNNREKYLDKISFSKNCLQITLWCWNRVD